MDGAKENEFPRELTLKAVYRIGNGDTEVKLRKILEQFDQDFIITNKSSSKQKFISYTISAYYETETNLTDVCTVLAEIEGFMMMV